jgi:hypothetical protein
MRAAGRAGGFMPLLGSTGSQILGAETGVLGDASKHPGTDLLIIVKGEDEVRPAGSAQGSM